MPRGGTPALVVLDAAAVPYRLHEFEADPTKRGFGQAAAMALGVELDRVFKTLIATVDDHDHVVAIVPVSGQLSLKELAAAVSGKRAEMCPPETAERLTGYVVGGISPFGQKRALPVVIDETCVLFDSIFVSGGRRGLDIEIAPDDLITLLGATTAPISTAN
ncbi:MAG: Cys-tRNA(Pro) deacylase [Ilumatobacteraceae bacterium]